MDRVRRVVDYLVGLQDVDGYLGNYVAERCFMRKQLSHSNGLVLSWDGAPHFRVAQAILQFHEVSALRMALDYAACSAGMTPFAIGAIRGEPLAMPAGDAEDDAADTPETGPWRWTIAIDWPEVADPETLSPKDRRQPALADLPNHFSVEGYQCA